MRNRFGASDGRGVGTAGRACAVPLLVTFVVAAGARAPARAQAPGDSDVVESVADAAGRPWAEGVAEPVRKRAHALFLDGNELFKRGLVGRAAECYRDAIELWDHPAFHYNLGVARMNLDQPIEAHDHFVRSREHGPVPIGEDKHQQAQVYINLLRSQLAELELVCEEPGADVAIDGKPVFTCPDRRRVLVRPGGHRVEATKPSYEPDIQQAVLAPGDTARVTLAPRVPAYLATARRWPTWISWTVAGASAALLVGAGAMDARSVLAFRRFDREFDERCSGPLGCTPEEVPGALATRLEHARAWQMAARVTYVAGGVALVTSSVLLYLNRERLVRRRGFIGEPAGVSLSPLLAPRAAGVSAQLRF